MPGGVVLPTDGFESYAGSYVALAAVWDVAGTLQLDTTAGHPHSGAWCATFSRFTFGTPSPELVYPKGGGAGSGLSETVFDATFWIAHDAPTDLGGPEAPAYFDQKAIARLLDGADRYEEPYVALSNAGGNIGVTGWTGNRYRTPPGTLPGDGVWRQVRLHVELDRNGTHGPGAGVVRIWIDGLLQLDETAAELAPWHAALGDPDPSYEGTYGAVKLTDEGGPGYTYWRLDDLNPVPPAARARCFLVA